MKKEEEKIKIKIKKVGLNIYFFLNFCGDYITKNINF